MTSATLQVPRDVIDPIIQAEVTKAIVEAMGGRQEMLTAAIAGILNTKVDHEGKVCGYDCKTSWLDWAIGNALRTAARDAITEVMTHHKDAIKEAMVAQLKQKNSPMIKQLVNGIIDAAANPDVLKYRISIAYDEKRR